MSGLLRSLLVVEGGILAVLFLVLLIWPVIVRLVEERRASVRRELVAAVRGALGDAGTGRGRRSEEREEEIRAALDRSRPRMLLSALEDLGEDPSGPGAADLARLVHETSAMERIRRAAGSGLWWRRQTAAQLLGRIGRPSGDRGLLVSLLRDSHPGVSAAAILSARELGWPSLAEPLLDLALDPEPGNRGQEALVHDTLSRLATDLSPLLADRIEAGPDRDEELTIMRIVRRLQDESFRPFLLDRLRRGSAEVRIQAAKTLAALFREPGTVDGLRKALEDPAWQVRTQAARALGTLEAEAATPDLRRALSDPSWWVRLRAALALRRLGRAGREILEKVDPSDDRYAADMADYVLGLRDAALREYGR